MGPPLHATKGFAAIVNLVIGKIKDVFFLQDSSFLTVTGLRKRILLRQSGSDMLRLVAGY